MKIILITSEYPYGLNETFIHNEVKFYEKIKNLDITFLPSKRKDYQRKLNFSFKLDSSLSKKKNKTISSKIYFFLKSLKYRVFYKELFRVLFTKPLAIRHFAFSISNFAFYLEFFESYFDIKKSYSNVIVYTYWNNEITYALQHLKYKYNFKLVSRIHGYDLFKERRPYNYMPLKIHFYENINKVFAVSINTLNYLRDNYRFRKEIIDHSYLGVKDPLHITQLNNPNKLHVVSCSRIESVKRLDILIESLIHLSIKRKDIKIYWSHFGDGYLKNKLINKYKDKLNEFSYTFYGNVENQKLYNFYSKNKIDLFINSSESEGLPISILEALSFGIPVIAPDIGGISEVIKNKSNGILLRKNHNYKDLLYAIEIFIDNDNKLLFKENSYKMFKNKFELNLNYSKFFKKIETIVQGN